MYVDDGGNEWELEEEETEELEQVDDYDGGMVDAGDDGGDGDVEHEPPPEYERYEPIEIALSSSKSYANPYTYVTVSAHVVGPGEEYDTPGFWDGENTWRVRFAPRNERDQDFH